MIGCSARLQLHGDLRRLQGFVDVAAHGDRRHAIAAPQDRVLHAHLDMADLLERDHAPIARSEGEIGEAGGVEPLGAGAAGDDIDRADILAHLRDRHAREQELQLLRGFGG